ncbi:MAG: HK97 gp10 family phage protein [Lachnospiraceae bacterium]|nr:HK97 gp10 family phage protein [Lachnospiraceae bacterium]
MSVEFTDNTMRVREQMAAAVHSFLYEAGGELQSQVIRNSRTDTGQTKGSYKYVVDKGTNEATVYVGSELDNAIWEEFGTGEYALNGDGRKGGWYIPEARLSAKAKSRMKKVIVKGKVYYYTKGKKPNRPIYNAFNSMKDRLKKRLQEVQNQM